MYDSEEAAQDAIDTMRDFDMSGKPMRLAFAKTRSDVTVKREDGEEGFEQHKRHRLAEKGTRPVRLEIHERHVLIWQAERKQAIEAANQKPTKRPATDALAERPAKTAKPAPSAAGAVPDEYLPPNKILFLRELPDDYGTVELAAIFNRYQGFKEVRTVPGRKGIAFVEYDSEEGAIAAKESTAGMTLGEKAIRVTFQRQ